MAQPLGQPAYAQRARSNTLKLIVEQHLEELRRVHDDRFRRELGPLHPRVVDLFERFVTCGDPHFGFLRFQCPDCKSERLVPFSCKARGLCPSCGKKRAVVWAEHLVEQVLPEVPYAPLVFTIPKRLRPYFKFEHGLYGDLCRAAYQAVRSLLAESFPDLEKPVPAFIACPQSFGSLLNFHPHCHGLVSLGVFDQQGEFHPGLDVDLSLAEPAFRRAVFAFLNKKGKIDDECIQSMEAWPHSGFRIHAERIIEGHDKCALTTVLEYMERPPVSLKRLEYFDTGMVVYRGNYHPQLKRAHQLVTGVEFLAMLVPHIQLRYEYKARCYGAISTTLRRRFGWIQPSDRDADGGATKTPEAEEDQQEVMTTFMQSRRRSWARLIRKVWLDDPELCPRCGTKMKLLSALSSPSQDDAIRSILEARGQWDPPWSSRGPPGHRAVHRDERIIEYECDPDQIWSDD